VAELKAFESDACSNPESESDERNDKGKYIIYAKPNAIVSIAKIHKNEPKDLEEGERLLHSQIWVKGSPWQLIVDSGNQNNLISAEVLKWVGLLTIPHLQPYSIGWLQQGWIFKSASSVAFPTASSPSQMRYCNVAPLDVCDVLLGKPYLWKQHAIYESRPHFVIISLVNMLGRIPEVAPLTTNSLISAKKCNKIISHTRKFIFFLVHSQNKGKITATSMALEKDSSMQQKQVDMVMKEYRVIFSSPTGVPLHCQVKHSFDITTRAPLPNRPIYLHSIVENV